MNGTVRALAYRQARRAPMLLMDRGEITEAAGLVGDHKGAKHPRRQITILAREDWQSALQALSLKPDALDWTVRRANILVSGIRLPRAAGSRLELGTVELEVTGQTYPCRRMDEAWPGLLKALAPEWRGGVTCRVVSGGTIALEDPVRVLYAPRETQRRLPG